MPTNVMASDRSADLSANLNMRGSRVRAGVGASQVVMGAALLTTSLAAFGLLAHWQITTTAMFQPSSNNIFLRLYGLYERPYLVLLGLFAISTLGALAWAGRTSVAEPAPDRLTPPTGRALLLLALFVGVIGLVTTRLVFHGFTFSMDEFGAEFQARLFARGTYAATLPWPWRSVGTALTPVFIGFDPASGRWLSQYLPMYALLKAPFLALGASSLLNPLLSALAILVLACVARRIWPAEGLRPWVAVGLLATSSELLVTAGTGYSMPAHLLLNLVWLWLYMRGDARSWGAALAVGVIALGLHNPFPHALFVAPFLLRLMRERRWSRVGSAALVYGFGVAVFLSWMRSVYPVARGANGGLLSLFAPPDLFVTWLQLVNVSVLLTWHAPVFAILLLAAVLRPWRLEPLLADLAAGALLTFVFFAFFPSTQGHGWGYRYAFQVLGNLCLLAAAAVPMMRAALGDVPTRRVLSVGFALALVVQIPLRLQETERFVRPFVAGVDYVRSRDALVVLVSGDSIWYGRDLIRNDPFLEAPIVMSLGALAPGSAEAIERTYPGRVVRVSDAELLRLGMTEWKRHQRAPGP